MIDHTKNTPMPLIITLLTFALSALLEFIYSDSEIICVACTFVGFFGGYAAMWGLKK